ncbi:MAG: element excision factor XisI family protein [Anaerolineae bacterium]
MDRLAQIVKEEVEKYAGTGEGINLRLFPISDDERKIYAVNAVDYPARSDSYFAVVMARVVGSYVIVEEDVTDKPLLDALLQRGIPRENIVLAYQGEPEPAA